jgi:hypothetical protein
MTGHSLQKNQININHRKQVFEGFSGDVSPPVVEGLVLIGIPFLLRVYYACQHDLILGQILLCLST